MNKRTSSLDKLVKKAGLVPGSRLDSLGTVAKRCALRKVRFVLDSVTHPLFDILKTAVMGSSSLFTLVIRFRRPFVLSSVKGGVS